MLKITLTKSTIGAIPKHRKTVEALGLKKLGRSVIQQDNDGIRGMIRQVSHMVRVEATDEVFSASRKTANFSVPEAVQEKFADEEAPR